MTFVHRMVIVPLVIILTTTSTYDSIWKWSFITDCECFQYPLNYNSNNYQYYNYLYTRGTPPPLLPSVPLLTQPPPRKPPSAPIPSTKKPKPPPKVTKKPKSKPKPKPIPKPKSTPVPYGPLPQKPEQSFPYGKWPEKKMFRRFSIPPNSRFYVEPTIRIPIVDNDTAAFHYTALFAVPISIYFDRLGWPDNKQMMNDEPETDEEVAEQEEEEDQSSANFAFNGDPDEDSLNRKTANQNFNNFNPNAKYRYRYPRGSERQRKQFHFDTTDTNQTETVTEPEPKENNDEDRADSVSDSGPPPDFFNDHDPEQADIQNVHEGETKGNINVHIRKTVRRKRSSSSSSSSFSLPHNGGERAELIPALEKIINSFGFKGSDCLLRAICEIHEYPLETGYGLIGEFITMFFSVSRSKFAQTHLRKYLEAEMDGKNQDCTPYISNCSVSIFQWHS